MSDTTLEHPAGSGSPVAGLLSGGGKSICPRCRGWGAVVKHATDSTISSKRCPKCKGSGTFGGIRQPDNAPVSAAVTKPTPDTTTP